MTHRWVTQQRFHISLPDMENTLILNRNHIFKWTMQALSLCPIMWPLLCTQMVFASAQYRQLKHIKLHSTMEHKCIWTNSKTDQTQMCLNTLMQHCIWSMLKWKSVFCIVLFFLFLIFQLYNDRFGKPTLLSSFSRFICFYIFKN